MDKLIVDACEIPRFCAGVMLYDFNVNRDVVVVADGAEQLKLLFTQFCNNGMLFIADCEHGVADRLLFKQLGSNEGSIPVPDGNLVYHLSPYYFNRNSGNMVRHLTCWLEYDDIDSMREQEDEDAVE